MEELPLATVRPRRLRGRLAHARGALSRWVRSKLRALIEGRHAPLLLTGLFFSGMMLAMGYVADRAQRAADAIDEAHREAARERAENAAVGDRHELPAPDVVENYEQDEDVTPGQPAALFYIRSSSR
jgi:hypothetical protein